MAGKEINIKGEKFNKLTALRYLGNELWEFKCECGKIISKKAADVKRGKTKSCSRICTTGNPSKHPLYQTWDGIKRRCYQKTATGYQNYGGRGIIMSESWKNSFWNFVSDMGDKPFSTASIDRIDNTEGYCKENCKWSSPLNQANNRRNNIYIKYQNQIYSLYSLCRLLGLKHSTVYWQLKKSKLEPQEFFNQNIFLCRNLN